jgi:hypothetical protein
MELSHVSKRPFLRLEMIRRYHLSGCRYPTRICSERVSKSRGCISIDEPEAKSLSISTERLESNYAAEEVYGYRGLKKALVQCMKCFGNTKVE